MRSNGLNPKRDRQRRPWSPSSPGFHQSKVKTKRGVTVCKQPLVVILSSRSFPPLRNSLDYQLQNTRHCISKLLGNYPDRKQPTGRFIRLLCISENLPTTPTICGSL